MYMEIHLDNALILTILLTRILNYKQKTNVALFCLKLLVFNQPRNVIVFISLLGDDNIFGTDDEKY